MKSKGTSLIILLIISLSSYGQRTQYYAYLGEKISTSIGNPSPSIYKANNGGVFLAYNNDYNQVKLTKFDESGNLLWDETYASIADGMNFVSLKETNNGKIVILVEVYWTRKLVDAVFIVLNDKGKEISRSFAIDLNPNFTNEPNDFYLHGDTILVFGKANNLGNLRPGTFVSYSNLNTGETYKVKNYSHPTNSHYPGSLIHFSPEKILFTAILGDTTSASPNSSLGLLTYYPINDSFVLKSVLEKSKLFSVVNEIKVTPEIAYTFGVSHKNTVDSTFAISFNNDLDYSSLLLKFDFKGNLIHQKRAQPSEQYGRQTIRQITSYSANENKLLIHQFVGDSIIDGLYLASMDSNLNIIQKNKFFTHSENFKTFLEQHHLKKEISISSWKWLFEMPYLISDKNGDLIFCTLAHFADSSNTGRILLVKIKSNGEVVTLNQTKSFSEEKHLIYPNPTEGMVTINLANKDNYEINVFDSNGRLVANETGSGYQNFSLLSLPPGTYLFSLTNLQTKETTTKKVIKLP